MIEVLLMAFMFGCGWFAHDRKPQKIVRRYYVLDLESKAYECDEKGFKYLLNGVSAEEKIRGEK